MLFYLRSEVCDVVGDGKGCPVSGWCGRFALVAVLVSAGCGGSGEATAEGLAVTAREVAEVAFSDPERMYDLLSAECQSSIPAEEWAAQADATKSMMDAMFGGAEVTVTEVRTRAVTATSGEAAATISVGGQDMGGGDEFQSYVFEDGAWKLASCDSMLGGETTTVSVEVEAEASVQLEVGTDSSDATTTTAAEPVDTEVAVLLGVYVWDETSEAVRELQVMIGATPDGNYGPKTREAHLAELNARGLATDHVPTAPQTTTTEPQLDERILLGTFGTFDNQLDLNGILVTLSSPTVTVSSNGPSLRMNLRVDNRLDSEIEAVSPGIYCAGTGMAGVWGEEGTFPIASDPPSLIAPGEVSEGTIFLLLPRHWESPPPTCGEPAHIVVTTLSGAFGADINWGVWELTTESVSGLNAAR